MKCLDSTWISSKGDFIEKFENEFSRKFKLPYSTTVTNGTVALHLALLALGVKAGDEVIVPTLTYVASVNAILYVGATPVFVDCDEKTWQLSVDDVEKKITSKTKAVLAVHLYGQPADMIVAASMLGPPVTLVFELEWWRLDLNLERTFVSDAVGGEEAGFSVPSDPGPQL